MPDRHGCVRANRGWGCIVSAEYIPVCVWIYITTELKMGGGVSYKGIEYSYRPDLNISVHCLIALLERSFIQQHNEVNQQAWSSNRWACLL